MDDADDTAAAGLLAQRGITTMPLSACRHEPAGPAGLLLGYADLPSHHGTVTRAIAEALERTAATNGAASDRSG